MYSNLDLIYRGLSFEQGDLKQNLKQSERKHILFLHHLTF